MARKSKPKRDPQLVEFGKQFPKGSMERTMWDRYTDASAVLEVHDKKGGAFKSDAEGRAIDPDGLKAWRKEGEKLTVMMFRAFDGFQHVVRNKVTVPQASIRQIVQDTLMEHATAVPALRGLSGLERYRRASELALDIYEAVKASQAPVREAQMEAIYCADCTASLS